MYASQVAVNVPADASPTFLQKVPLAQAESGDMQSPPCGT
jgi:hypothetical protein